MPVAAILTVEQRAWEVNCVFGNLRPESSAGMIAQSQVRREQARQTVAEADRQRAPIHFL